MDLNVNLLSYFRIYGMIRYLYFNNPSRGPPVYFWSTTSVMEILTLFQKL